MKLDMRAAELPVKELALQMQPNLREADVSLHEILFAIRQPMGFEPA
jgi:hypothetical protein